MKEKDTKGAEKSCVAAAKTIAKEEMERRGWIVKVYLCCTEKFSVSSLFSKEPHEFLDRWEHDIICAITRRRHGRQEDQL